MDNTNNFFKEKKEWSKKTVDILGNDTMKIVEVGIG